MDSGGRSDAAPGEKSGRERSQGVAGSTCFHLSLSASSAEGEEIATRLRVTWEGDVEGLHSLAIVNRALCTALMHRGHNQGVVSGSNSPHTITPERLPLNPLLAARLVIGPEGVRAAPVAAQSRPAARAGGRGPGVEPLGERLLP
jgi:hypothetical protein